MKSPHAENRLREDLDYILDNTGELWDELRGQRIFITGGTGFFGCWLLESFAWADKKLELNASATVLTRNPEAFRKKAPHLAFHPAIKFHTGDVKTFEFPDERFTHVIHASNEAADYPDNEENAADVKDAIILAARHTLDFARHCGAHDFLFTSSGTVYGPQPSELTYLPETYEGVRDSSEFRFAHGEGKFIAETLCSDYQKYGIASKIARCFTFVGPYMRLDANYAIGNFIGNVLNNEPVLVRGDGTPYRSYLYAADLAIWLWTILLRGISCRPYNVGSDVGVTIADTASQVAHFLPVNKVLIAGEASLGKPAERYVPSVLRSRRELGLKQNIDLHEAIRRTIRWYSMRKD